MGRLRRGALVLAGVLGVAAAVVVVVLVGVMIPSRPQIALLAAVAVLALGVSFLEPAAIPLLAMPAVLVVARVGSGVDISVSDVALFLAVWPAIFLAKRPYSHEMRTLLWLATAYQVATLFTVLANPYTANTVDWVHTWLLVAGSLVVGWAVGRQGYGGLGLTLILLVAGLLAVSTILQGARQYASGDFGAVYTAFPFPMHKNFVGTVLGAAALMAYVRPSWMGWTRTRALSLFWLCTVAVLFSQSRQALIALVVALVFVVLRTDPDRPRSRIVLLVAAPAALLVATTVKDQVNSGNRFNSTLQRLTWFQDSYRIWQHDPVFGVGLRWWYTDRFAVSFQPPNAEMEVLTTAGVVGLAGFLVLMIGALRVLARVDPRYGTLPLALLVNRLVQGQLDLFWSSVGASLPFVVIGICLGAQAYDAHESPVPRDPLGARATESHGATT